MNDRPTPTEHALALGTITEAVPDLTESQLRRELMRSSILTGAEVLSMQPRRWIVRSWLPADALVAVYAPPGAGKSFYAVTLALELAHGARWIERLPRSYRVLYVAAEKAADTRDRVEAWSTATGHRIPPGFMLMNYRLSLTAALDVPEIVALVEELGIEIVILDTYAAVTPGLDENSAQAVGPVMGDLHRIREATRGGSVIAVHHSGKNTAAGMRGSTAFLGSVDLTIEITATSDSTIEARVEKTNAGPKPLPEHYLLEPVTLSPLAGETQPRSVPRLVHTGAPVLSGTLQESILQAFRDYCTGPATRRELEQALADLGVKTSPGNLNKTLKRMWKLGHLQQSGTPSRPRYAPTGSVEELPLGEES